MLNRIVTYTSRRARPLLNSQWNSRLQLRTASTASVSAPWKQPMPEAQFATMREILYAPSPVGLEGAMTYGVLKPYFESFMPDSWKIHQFKGNAGIVVDTHPDRRDMFTLMIIGHADKIRMQVRSIAPNGKIWVDSDSFLPLTLLGNHVKLFSEDPKKPGSYRTIEGGTIEALGAIHFASGAMREGAQGVKKEQLYLELGIHGENGLEQVSALGIRPGDALLMDRPIKRQFSPDTFSGAYLDNGLGCFVTAEVAKLMAADLSKPTNNVRVLFAMAAYEEIGRFGSRVLAGELKPDAIIATDVNHDYVAAPGVGDKNFTPLKMGAGFTLSVGSIASETLNRWVEEAAMKHEIPYQRDVCGRDTGTDAMAGVLASVDCAATSIGFPIRNMHTISELGHTGDVLSAVHVIYRTIEHMGSANDGKGVDRTDLENGHPRLDQSQPLHNQYNAEASKQKKRAQLLDDVEQARKEREAQAQTNAN